MLSFILYLKPDSRAVSPVLLIGRQELNFADARLIWNKNWLHQAASHDAVNLQCRNKNIDINRDIGFS